jgi:hypothetical protein
MKDVTAELLLLISYNAVFGQRNVARSKEMLGNLIFHLADDRTGKF